MTRFHAFMLGIFLFTLQPALAQTTLTLRQSIEIALRNNPEIMIAEQGIQKSLYARTQARSGRLPSISAMGYYDRSWELPIFVFSPPAGFPGANGEIRVQMGVEHTINSGITLEQPLYTGGALSAQERMASRAVDISELQYSSTQQEIIADVYDSFFRILLTAELIRVAEGALESAEENLRQIQRRYEQGAASRFERLRAEVQASTLRPHVTEARHNYELAVEHLFNILGMDVPTNFTVDASFIKRESTLLQTDVEELIAVAYRNRPEYRMLETQERMNRDGVRLARSNFLPKVLLSSSMNWQALQDDISGLRGNDFTRFSSSQLIVQVPLFNGFANTARYQEAQAQLRQTQIQREHSRKLIATEIRSLQKRLKQAAEILQSQEEVVQQAEEGLRLANLLYEEGAATLLEVIDAQVAYTQAQTSYFQAIYNFNTTSVRLERAMGILSTESF